MLRDYVLLLIVGIAALAALRRPWIGVMLWTWLSIMNPHRYCYGIAYSAPLALTAAVATAVGFVLTSDERSSPFRSSAVIAFFLFMCLITLSWVLGLDVAGDLEQWTKVMKIDVMVLVGLMLLHSKKHILAILWVSAGSLLLLGAKGGLFTLVLGGTERVWGPPGSFIEDNNEFGLALIMAIPLLRFLQMQLRWRSGRWLMTAGMLLCGVAAIGTQSRGALLAISAMVLVLWWRGKNRIVAGALIVMAVVAVLAFMPDKWYDRMNTIETYQQDSSAQERLAAWSASWNIARHYPLGIGFNIVNQDLFDKFSHNPEAGARAAHSIYFQVLGNHGFGGLFLFLMIWLITYRHAGWLRKRAAKIPEARWCADLGAMAQVSLVGYAVGGAFLSLAYFDLPYTIMMVVALARVWVMSEAWKREPAQPDRWFTLPGLLGPSRAAG